MYIYKYRFVTKNCFERNTKYLHENKRFPYFSFCDSKAGRGLPLRSVQTSKLFQIIQKNKCFKVCSGESREITNSYKKVFLDVFVISLLIYLTNTLIYLLIIFLYIKVTVHGFPFPPKYVFIS